MMSLSRRAFLLAVPVGVAGCATNSPPAPPTPIVATPPQRFPTPAPEVKALYEGMKDGDWELPAVDLTLVDPRYLRQKVTYSSPYPVGTIVVDTPQHFLYLVQENETALRYGIGVGREGFAWSGEAQIARKAAWPFWYPPVEMQARDEKARRWAGGMPGGLDNPLGARALYLYQDGRDTLYRIHGTAEARTIGRNVSSGCIRMINHDVIDLSARVPVGTNVVVLEVQTGES